MDITRSINHFYYRMAMCELQVMNDEDYYHGLSYNSILYINIIDQTPDCTASRIAQTLNITRAAVTLKLNELIRQGAVVKEQSKEDRRVYYVRLSPKMRDVMNVYDEIFLKIEEDLKKRFTGEQLDTFSQVLGAISEYEWRKIRNE